MKNKFKINFGNIEYGWLIISLYNNNKISIGINGSGIYNPLYELPKLLKKISLNKNVIWKINQESFFSVIQFKQLGRGLISIETEEFRTNLRFKKTINIYFKRDVLKEFKEQLIKFEKDNYEGINNKFYDFSFDIKNIKRLR